jgi:RNA polymerase sigma factor (sigma-70 family)
LCCLADGPAAADLTDGQLLERFCSRREESAFALLLLRHGPMVLAVCRRTLADAADAEDAFQATFLVLARKAAAIRKRQSVASWLHGVAYRIAVKARAHAARRRLWERKAAIRTPAGPLAELAGQELRAVLEEELSRLPEKYRTPVILCDLEGKTHEQAAGELGCPKSSLSSRLVRARGLLQQRVLRRGITLSAGLAGPALIAGTAPAAVPARLTSTALQQALPALSGRAVAAGLLPNRVVALAEGALQALTPTGAKISTALLVAVAAVCLGAGLLGYRSLPARPPAGRTDNPAPPTGSRDRSTGSGPAQSRTDRQGDPLPAGAVARMGTLRFRHQHTIARVAFAADGKTVLSASWDGTVRVWEASTSTEGRQAGGRELRRFGPLDGVTAPAFSPGGKTAATVADPPLRAGVTSSRKTLRLWDLASDKELRRIDSPEKIDRYQFAPDGALLATCGDRIIRCWESATGKEICRISLPEGDSGPMTFAADGRTLAAACADGTIRLWEPDTGRERTRFPSPQGTGVGCLAFTPDGRTLASGGRQDDRTVRLLDAATGKEACRFGPYEGWVDSVAFSPDGRRLATGDKVGTIRVYDVAAGKELYRCGLHGGDWVLALAFSPDGKTLAAGGTNEKAVRFFDPATGEEQRPYAGHQDEVTGAALLPDGKTIVSAGRDGLVCVWDPAGGRVVRQWTHPGGALALALAPDGKSLATAGGDGTVRFWDPASGKELRRLVETGGRPVAVAFSPDGALLGVATDGVAPTIGLWDLDTEKERLRIRPPGQFVNPLPFAFAPDGKTLVSSTGNQAPDHPLCVWDVSTGKELRRLPGHPGDALCLAISPDGQFLASAGWGERIRVTEVATGQTVQEFKAYARVLAFSPDGRVLASGSVDGTISLWDRALGQEARRFEGHSPGGKGSFQFAAGVSALAFTADGKRLVSGGGDTTVLLWDLADSVPSERQRPQELTQHQLDDLWEALSSAAAARADGAVWALVAAPGQSVPLLEERLRPVAAADGRRVAGLIAGLDSEQFQERSEAAAGLEKLGEAALPGLRKALASRPSPEVRRRLEELLEKLADPASPTALRALRGVEVLEHLDTRPARALLEALAGGMAEARLTQEAKAALERLAPQTGRP